MQNQQPRRFPLISKELYSASSLASVAPPKGVFLFTIRPPGPDTRFAQILVAHRRGFEAELAAAWDRADFYWKELARLIRAAALTDSCWNAGREVLFHDEPGFSGAEFRRAFLTQVVCESHAAFFAAQVRAGCDPMQRPRFHLQALSGLLKSLPEVTAEDEAALVDSLAGVAVEYYTARQSAAGIDSFWWIMVDCFPRQTRYVSLSASEVYASAQSGLKDASDARKVDVLEKAVGRAATLRAKSPTVIAGYQLLGVLYHDLAICLANVNRVPDASLAAKKSEIYGGQNPVLEATQQQLDQIVVRMKENASRIRLQVAGTPGAQLNAQGWKLVGDADIGHNRAMDWADSSEADQIRKQREVASQTPTPPVVTPDKIPTLHLAATAKTSGKEDLEDWLRSGTSRRVRVQIAVAAILLVLTVGLLGREAWGIHARRSALERAEAGLNAGNDTVALDALATFFAAPKPLRDSRQNDRRVVQLYADTLTRWLASRHGTLSAEDRRRVETYRRQIVVPLLDMQAEVSE